MSLLENHATLKKNTLYPSSKSSSRLLSSMILQNSWNCISNRMWKSLLVFTFNIFVFFIFCIAFYIFYLLYRFLYFYLFILSSMIFQNSWNFILTRLWKSLLVFTFYLLILLYFLSFVSFFLSFYPFLRDFAKLLKLCLNLSVGINFYLFYLLILLWSCYIFHLYYIFCTTPEFVF